MLSWFGPAPVSTMEISGLNLYRTITTHASNLELLCWNSSVTGWVFSGPFVGSVEASLVDTSVNYLQFCSSVTFFHLTRVVSHTGFG